MKAVHAIRDRVFGKLSSCSTHIMVVDVHHAEFRLQLHGLREQGNKLVQGLFSIWHLRVIHEYDTVSILLNRSPALLILEITGSVPELNVNLAEICNTWRGIAFEVNNSIIKLVAVLLKRDFSLIVFRTGYVLFSTQNIFI